MLFENDYIPVGYSGVVIRPVNQADGFYPKLSKRIKFFPAHMRKDTPNTGEDQEE